MKRRVLSIILALTMVLSMVSFSGCGKSKYEKNTMTASELAYLMGNGINLGNTMEAVGGRSDFIKNGVVDVTKHETSWGQPVTTQEMITGMKNSGFDTIRIPVAWCNMVNIEGKDYTINQAYIDRVKEIIDYARNADMYVIVNDHWDSSWWGMFGAEDQATRDEAMKIYESIWTQIATAYADYDYHLILESANEELGDSLNDVRFCDDSGYLSEDECYEMTNTINQKFVDIVRSCGGYNQDRFLLIAGYNTDFDRTCDDRFQMPTDTVEDKLLLSVHFYQPWTFCGDDCTGNAWGTIKDYEDMAKMFKKVSKFSEAGYPVVIGEYGVLHLIEDEETGELREKDNIMEYMTNLLDLSDYYGFVPVLWETGALYSKNDASMKFEDTKGLYASRSFSAQSSMSQDEEKAAAIANSEANAAAAPESLANTDFTTGDSATVIATIMFQNASWGNGYSVGDVYAPDTSTGIVPTEVEITGEGTYTVGLDFSKAGDNKGTQFSALAVYNGETTFPGYYCEITSLKINGEEAETLGDYYTTSDNEICTRVNLYNEWVPQIPDTARRADGNLANATAQYIERKNDKVLLQTQINTLEITFDYVAPENAAAYTADRDAWAAGIQ